MSKNRVERVTVAEPGWRINWQDKMSHNPEPYEVVFERKDGTRRTYTRSAVDWLVWHLFKEAPKYFSPDGLRMDGRL